MLVEELTIVPANQASWDDLQAVLGTRGPAATCQCQRYKLRPKEAFAKFPVEERARRLLAQTNCGRPSRPPPAGSWHIATMSPSAGAPSSRDPRTKACCATASPGRAARRTKPTTASGR